MTVFNDMLELLKLSYYARDEIVPCLAGPPGIGKTAAVEQHAKDLGVGLHIIIANHCLPSDIIGMKMPDMESRTLTIIDDEKLANMKDGDILFLDELLEAPQEILSSLLTIIQSRRMFSGKKLADIQIIAATNLTLDPHMIKDSIKQRFWWAEFDIDRDGCGEYIKEKYNLNLSKEVLGEIESSSKNFNILTQRSLSKNCEWIERVPEDDRYKVVNWINRGFKSTIGNRIIDSFTERDNNPNVFMLKQISNVTGLDYNLLANMDINELMQTLQANENWDSIKSTLENIDVSELVNDDKEVIAF